MLKRRILILLLLITSCSYKKTKPASIMLYSDRYAEKLNGNVKRLIEKSTLGDYFLVVDFN
ncbi:hypothetical protein LX99_04088 [Mucilaginibacter oryzae]|uniref:Uncharacterized protein n=1 Tax=Mucilaginibacter oryzae TaxID=468058 RepID=A0A316H484_9SPHI|nr:hypothetical protein LX99_04088 [Mucilaginibacter oryzae]